MAIPAINSCFTELSNGSSVPCIDAMKYEALRLGSFRKYPEHLPQSALKLASAGFFFTGVDEEVECFSCSLKLKDWGVNDVPLEVHIKYSPDCPYVNNNLEGNIPLASKGLVRAAASAVTQQFSQLSTNGNQQYSNIERLASFTNWPSNAAVRPDDLARSGFYYTESDDHLQCTFGCGILRNWEPNDEPEAEHRRHFGQCPFLSNRYGVGNITFGDPPVNRNDLGYQDYYQSIVTEKPVHQNYSFPADRLATFKDFPTNMTQSPEMFVGAGFYYSARHLTEDVQRLKDESMDEGVINVVFLCWDHLACCANWTAVCCVTWTCTMQLCIFPT